MSQESTVSSPKYTQKILSLAQSPKHRGAFFSEDAKQKNMALVTAKYKDIKVYWLVEPEMNIVYDAKFFAYGGTLSIALGELICSMAKGLSLKSACALKASQVEMAMRDDADQAAVAQPEQSLATMEPLLQAIDEAYPEAKAVALATIQLQKNQTGGKSPVNIEALNEAEKQWMESSKEIQIEKLNEILDKDVRPGLNSDGGDLEIIDIEDSIRLKVRYQGACGSCASSTGATLSFIEDTLRRNLHSQLQVIPIE